MPNGNILKIDISFIPSEGISKELLDLSKKKMVFPYSEQNLMDLVAENQINVKEATVMFKNLNNLKDNYWKFESTLIEFGNSLFKNRKLDLSEKIFNYLIELGSKSPIVKESLIKIYIKKGDRNGIKWVFERIGEQLNDKIDYHYYKKKIIAIKIKYADYIKDSE